MFNVTDVFPSVKNPLSFQKDCIFFRSVYYSPVVSLPKDCAQLSLASLLQSGCFGCVKCYFFLFPDQIRMFMFSAFFLFIILFTLV